MSVRHEAAQRCSSRRSSRPSECLRPIRVLAHPTGWRQTLDWAPNTRWATTGWSADARGRRPHSSPYAAPVLSVAVLGPVELRRDGQRLQLPGGKTSELLVRLALEAGRTVRPERLIDDLWGDQGFLTAKNTLQSKVSQLRRALGDPLLVVSGSAGYSLAIEASAVDALEVIRLAELTATLLHAGESSEALRSSSAALAMFRGDVFADAGDAEWLRPHRVRLQEVHEQLIEDDIAARLDLGAAAELIGDLEALVGLHPLRERLRGQQMLALYRAGRQAEALRAYQTAREVLAEELGLEPGRELQRLEAAILVRMHRSSCPNGLGTESRLGWTTTPAIFPPH